jgi:hypothetical protein
VGPSFLDFILLRKSKQLTHKNKYIEEEEEEEEDEEEEEEERGKAGGYLQYECYW